VRAILGNAVKEKRMHVARQNEGVASTGHGLRVAMYLRVSTGRQAETDLSIPDQRRQIDAWCHLRGHAVFGEYTELGASATDDKRPEFQRMIDRACDGDNAVDLIVVHSYSRFFRDSFGLEFYLRKLAKHGVKLISITQEFNDDNDPAQAMLRKVVALFDEYQSKEIAKHVLRSMKENARQGYWNGARPPYGYTAVAVEQRGARIKKRLAIDVVEAEQVRLVYRLFLEGLGSTGPMGIKAIVNWLNANGHRTRSGAAWGVGPVHVMLTNTVYMGIARFNIRDSKTQTRKSETEHVTAEAPIIVDPPIFERVQSQLKARNPRANPPRVVSGPILLTGLTYCATCSGAMTLRTGTSKTGKVHKYYSCSTCARQGKTVCKGRSIRMDKLDDLVTSHLMERLLAPVRLEALLVSVAARRVEKAAEVNDRITGLKARADEADERLRRLYKMVEDGVTEMDDLLKVRVSALKADRETAFAALTRARGTNRVPIVIPGENIEAFGRLMRERLTAGAIPFRKAYLGAIIDRVEVDDHQIRICGRKDVLEQAVLANGGPIPGVRSFVRRWRARKDSNLRPPDS
jgi:site-specific DNA recombinase